MELRDYRTALRRFWTTWTAVTLAGLLASLVVVLVSRPTYQATAEVFVASTSDSSNSGAQFVSQRVTSYPDIASSRTVLDPVISQLGLPETFESLHARISATNPTGTSQIQVAATDADAVRAAQVANAVAARFSTTVEALERSGKVSSPVQLTVTNPATVPVTPVSPRPGLLIPLGLVVGLALGAALAIVRSRRDTRLHTADDVRAAWGDGGRELVVHSSPPRRGRVRLIGRPATLVARQLEPVTVQRPVSVVAVSPSARVQGSARAFADDVAAQLESWQVAARVTGTPDEPAAADGALVHLTTASPLAPVADWRHLASSHDGVVIVVPPGRVDRAELLELRSVLAAAGAEVLAAVLPHRRSRSRSRSGGSAAPARRSPVPSPADAPRPERQEAVAVGSS